jgi:hypothetical protein
MLGGLPIELFLLSIAFSIGLCVHAVKTHQDTFWLWIILMFQPLGGLAYLVINVVMPAFSGTTARKIKSGAAEALDPHRAYREAKAALQDTPTVHNRMKLAAAAAGMGRFDEAEALYREAAEGVHADDPALLLGRARALVELGRYAEALPVLDHVRREGETTPQSTLVLARAYEGLGRKAEAEAAYLDTVERLPGLEAIARYAVFLARTGRAKEAQDTLVEIDRRVGRTTGPFRREARAWRDFAAAGLK